MSLNIKEVQLQSCEFHKLRDNVNLNGQEIHFHILHIFVYRGNTISLLDAVALALHVQQTGPLRALQCSERRISTEQTRIKGRFVDNVK